jgi:16S rRNA (cytosine967-C5)-methyltransferase
VKKIPAASLWFWLARRCELDVSELRIPDMHERNQFFESAQGRITGINEPALNAWSLLWYAMRPCWKTLLDERVAASQWSPEQVHTFINRQTQMPPLWLRPQQQATAETLAAALRQEGVDVALTPEGYVCARGGKGVANTRAYKEGLVEIQDLASQQIAAAVAAKPGQKVWDACAGAGGKSLAIAAQMRNKGMLLATDLHARKLDELKRRAGRAQLFNLRTFTWDGTEPLRLPKEAAQQQGFDWVLVDAPCSSAGTWRRNPDARWRFNEADTCELIDLQRRILTHAARAVRPGGHLVYATCSWQVSENEAQVEWFVQNHPGFRLDYQRLPGSPLEDADTMFVAVLVLSGSDDK